MQIILYQCFCLLSWSTASSQCDGYERQINKFLHIFFANFGCKITKNISFPPKRREKNQPDRSILIIKPRYIHVQKWDVYNQNELQQLQHCSKIPCVYSEIWLTVLLNCTIFCAKNHDKNLFIPQKKRREKISTRTMQFYKKTGYLHAQDGCV